MTSFEVLHVPLKGLDVFPSLHLLEAHPVRDRVLGVVLKPIRRLVAGGGFPGQAAGGEEQVGPAVALEVPALPFHFFRGPRGRGAPCVVTEDEVFHPRSGDVVVDAFEVVVVPLLFENPDVVAQGVEPVAVAVQGPVEVVAMFPGPEQEALRARPDPLHQGPVAQRAGQVVVEPAANLKGAQFGANRRLVPILAFPERPVGGVEHLAVPVGEVASGPEVIERQERPVGQHIGPGSAGGQLAIVHEERVVRHADQHAAADIRLIGKGGPH